MSTPIVNDHAIVVCAPRRSGHHAVIQWILLNARDRAHPVAFLNSCAPRTNPYDTAVSRDNRLAGVDAVRERKGERLRKSLLVCNYEDRDLADVYPPWFGEAMTAWTGASRRTTHVLVLRDPFNLIASAYQWMRRSRIAPSLRFRPDAGHLRSLPALWKTYAREFLGHTRTAPRPLVCISYNRWLSDRAYRQQLATMLDLSSDDTGRERVAPWGPNTWSNSFDDMAYDGRATQMKVLERWRHFADDEAFRALFHDRELVELSEAIFGVLPGTERLTAAAEELLQAT